jgi:hypothetical protein
MSNASNPATAVREPAAAVQTPVLHAPISVPSASVVPLSPASPSTTVAAPASSVSVTVPATAGTVTFSLVVTDNLGVESAPAFATVSIQAPPVAVLTAAPSSIPAGGVIQLSGASSSSSGSIAKYTFALVPATAVV